MNIALHFHQKCASVSVIFLCPFETQVTQETCVAYKLQ